MKQKIRFIINPISGVGKKGDLPFLIEQNLDHSKFEYDIKYTEYRKHAKEIARAASEEKIDIVCAVGGAVGGAVYVDSATGQITSGATNGYVLASNMTFESSCGAGELCKVFITKAPIPVAAP